MRLIVPCAIVVIGLCLSGCGSDRSSDAAASSGGATHVAPAPASDQATGGPTPAAAPSTAAGADLPKSVNTLDPVDGLPVDPTLAPVIVEIDVVSPPVTVVVGISSAENGKHIQADPVKYAGAALHNRVARLETDTLLLK